MKLMRYWVFIVLLLSGCVNLNEMVTFVDGYNGFRITLSSLKLLEDVNANEPNHLTFDVKFVNVATTDKVIPSYDFVLQYDETRVQLIDESNAIENELLYVNHELAKGDSYTDHVVWFSSSSIDWNTVNQLVLLVRLNEVTMYRFNIFNDVESSLVTIEPIL